MNKQMKITNSKTVEENCKLLKSMIRENHKKGQEPLELMDIIIKKKPLESDTEKLRAA